MNFNKFKCRRPSSRSLSQDIDPVVYNHEIIGFRKISGDGKGVKICVIDSGSAVHKDLSIICPDHVVDFTQSLHGSLDVHGHGTAVAGILTARNHLGLTGFCPSAEVFYAKGINDKGLADYNNVVASLLWAIIKEVDIIVMAFGSQTYSQHMHDAIKKAYRHNIAMFAAAGSFDPKVLADFPARLPEVMAVGWEGSKINKGNDSPNKIHLPMKAIKTTFLKEGYFNMSGTSSLCAAAAGISAVILQQARGNKKAFANTSSFYKNVLSYR